ncbi:hypothetical protein CDAR_433001 [Caerostris darwini]|uniref:Uncharacterized protein n=1 Tax=Caerostris darwini TaxID=1538125 RepID=A0AAV4QEV1_9ARAC|nr:hypothetical protein CDAR_433001 [Caerostris darwini]
MQDSVKLDASEIYSGSLNSERTHVDLNVPKNERRGYGRTILLSLLITKAHTRGFRKTLVEVRPRRAKKPPDPTPSSLWVGDDLWPPPLSFADAAEHPQTPPHSPVSFSVQGSTVRLSCPVVCLGSLLGVGLPRLKSSRWAVLATNIGFLSCGDRYLEWIAALCSVCLPISHGNLQVQNMAIIHFSQYGVAAKELGGNHSNPEYFGMILDGS